MARLGVYLHWVADRASHWYCTDSNGSGIAGVKGEDGDYNLYLYLDGKRGCSFITHSMAHYWVCEEGGEGLGRGPKTNSMVTSNLSIGNMYQF